MQYEKIQLFIICHFETIAEGDEISRLNTHISQVMSLS